ncbi:MAG: hypothetical protein ABSG65_34860 [Bryobacteraceae bacterium]
MFQQLVHQDDEKLALRAEVGIEGACGRAGPGGERLDGRRVVTLLGKQASARRQELPARGEAARLPGRGGQILIVR